MKSDIEVNEQVDEANKIQEGRAKKGTTNAKNYTSQCTGLGLYKMFVALPEDEKGVLHATCFVPLLLIDPIATMSTLVVEIFDHHLGDMKMRRFYKKKNTYGLKEIDDALKHAKLERHQENVLRLNLLKIILSFLISSKGRNVWVKYVDLADDLQQNQIEAPAIGVAPAIDATPKIEPLVVGAPVIGSSSFATEIRVVVVRICSQLEEHGKMMHNHAAKHKREGGNEKEDGKRKKAEPRIKNGKGKWQKKAEEADVPNKKKKVKGLKKKAFTDDQFYHVPLIQLKALIPKIPRKGLSNRVPRKRRVAFPELENIQSTIKNLLQQVTPGEGMEMEELKNGDEKVDDVEKDGKEKESEEEQPQTSADQTTAVSVEEQTIEVAQTEVVISHQEEDVGEASQVNNVYIKALIQYFNTQHRAHPDKEKIVLANIFV
ncbi:hypothetical protein GIB67_018969 [Kingdonia uniflora]|uniref:Uncharacterized protein n=1 Tax=Kingdonia uniflora TaxID=39325 RepID=A0A7J7MGQ3_9MAGN|nr:hypothetical protein GIB67_018969 [Kingdonia uniflora]